MEYQDQENVPQSPFQLQMMMKETAPTQLMRKQYNSDRYNNQYNIRYIHYGNNSKQDVMTGC